MVCIGFALTGDVIALAANTGVCTIGAGVIEPGETDCGFVNVIGGATAAIFDDDDEEAADAVGRTLLAPLQPTMPTSSSAVPKNAIPRETTVLHPHVAQKSGEPPLLRA